MKTRPSGKQKVVLRFTCSQHYSFVPCFLALRWVVWEEAGIPAQSLFPTCHSHLFWTLNAVDLDCREPMKPGFDWVLLVGVVKQSRVPYVSRARYFEAHRSRRYLRKAL